MCIVSNQPPAQQWCRAPDANLSYSSWSGQHRGKARWVGRFLLCLAETLFPPPSPCEAHLLFLAWYMRNQNKLPKSNEKQQHMSHPGIFSGLFSSVPLLSNQKWLNVPAENSYIGAEWSQSSQWPPRPSWWRHPWPQTNTCHSSFSPHSSMAPWSCPLPPNTGTATLSQLVQDTFSMRPLLTTLFKNHKSISRAGIETQM